MNQTKIFTFGMKSDEFTIREAGKVHFREGYPWFCAFGYVASAAGSSDALLVAQAASWWLTGWVTAYETDTKKKIPKNLRTTLDTLIAATTAQQPLPFGQQNAPESE